MSSSPRTPSTATDPHPVAVPAPSAPTPRAPTGRRAELLVAAVDVVADSGLRGLTHRAVDRRAGLPEGTCSAYLRTRVALLVAVAEFVGARLESRVEALAADLAEGAGDPAAVAAAVTDLTLEWVRSPAVVRAQAELSLEAARRPDLRPVFERWRRDLLRTVSDLGTRAGHAHPEQDAVVVVAAVEGLLVTSVRMPEAHREPFLREAVPLLVHALHDGG